MAFLEEQFIWSSSAAETTLSASSVLPENGEIFSVPPACPETGLFLTIRFAEATNYLFLSRKELFLTVTDFEYHAPALSPAAARALRTPCLFRSARPRRSTFTPKSITQSRTILRL